MKGIIYYELLEIGQTVNSTRYFHQLKRLNEEIKKKRTGPGHGNRKVSLLHDNAKPHVAKLTQKTIMDLN